MDSNSNTLRDVMKADLTLGNSGASKCWTRQLKEACQDLQNGTIYKNDLMNFRKLNISNLRADLRFRHLTVWREAHGQDPTDSKKSVVYHNWFAGPLRNITDFCTPAVLPEYLTLALNRKMMRNVSRFRLRAHNFKCETGLYGAGDRCARTFCDFCGDDENQDERHIVFSCMRTDHLRQQFSHLFDGITNGDIKGFVFQHNSEVYKFIDAAVDLFD